VKMYGFTSLWKTRIGRLTMIRQLSMKALLMIITLAMVTPLLAQNRSIGMQEEILKLEKEFGQAMIKNDVEAIGRILADDWIIIDPDGGVIDRSRFLSVIRSGALSHEAMDSDDIRVRIYGNTATVTALTTSKGKFMGQEFTTQERATDVFVMENGRWQCVLSQLTRFTKK
jgi:ketosteroid isomerase-like protein